MTTIIQEINIQLKYGQFKCKLFQLCPLFMEAPRFELGFSVVHRKSSAGNMSRVIREI